MPQAWQKNTSTYLRERMKVNISIDDVSPHPMSSVKVIERCREIIKKFPEAKFSLFVPMWGMK